MATQLCMVDGPSPVWLQMTGFAGACCYVDYDQVADPPGMERHLVSVAKIEQSSTLDSFVVQCKDGTVITCLRSHVAEVGWLPVEEHGGDTCIS